MLAKSNNKLGNILHWSIPALHTCPGHSEVCKSVCYATRGFYQMPSVKKSQATNDTTRAQQNWETRIIAEINRNKTKILRIHASGDFDTPEYAEQWCRIIAACPSTTFYAYTRSWNVPGMTSSLVKMAQLENMTLWFSADKSMPVPPMFDFIKIAYLAMDDDDQPQYAADLVFRYSAGGTKTQKTVRKRMGRFNSLVCPIEQGQKETDLTCEKCKICFDSSRKPKLVQISSLAGQRVPATAHA